MTDTRRYSRMNGPRLPNGPRTPVTAGSSPHTPLSSDSRRSLPAPPSLQVSPNSFNGAVNTPPSSTLSTRRSPLPIPPSIDPNARRASVAVGGHDQPPLPRGSLPRPLPTTGGVDSGRRASYTGLPSPPAPNGGLPPESDFAPRSGYDRFNKAQTVGSRPPRPASPPPPVPLVQMYPATPPPMDPSPSLPPAPAFHGAQAPARVASPPFFGHPTDQVEAPPVPLARLHALQESLPLHEPQDHHVRAVDENYQLSPPSLYGFPQPATAHQTAPAPIEASAPVHQPFHETASTVSPYALPPTAPAMNPGFGSSTTGALTASPPQLAAPELPPHSDTSGGFSQSSGPHGPPVPKRTDDVRQYAQRSGVGSTGESGALSGSFNALSLETRPRNHAQRMPIRISTPWQGDLPPVSADIHHSSRPTAMAAISQENIARQASTQAPFVPTAESAATSSVVTDGRDRDHIDEFDDSLPPPYHVASAHAPPSISAPYVSPAVVSASSPTTTTSPTSTIARQTSIIADDAAVTRMHSVRDPPERGTIMQPSEVLAVAVSATQQSATVRQTMLTPVSEPSSTPIEDDDETVYRSRPPHLTVIGSGCFLLAYDYRPGPVPEWDSPVRVILNSKSQEVIIHEHQNTPKWRRDETREYIKMLIELHNEVVEEIDDSYAAFGSRGGDAAGLGVGTQIRTASSPITGGPSLPSSAGGAASPPPVFNAPQRLPHHTSPSAPRHTAQAPAPQSSQVTQQTTGNQSINLTAPRPAIVSHRVATLRFGLGTPSVSPPPWLIDSTAYLLSDTMLVIDCHEGTPEQLRQALVGAFGSSYGALCKSLSQIEQTIVNAFRDDLRLRNLEISVPSATPPNVARLVININTAGANIPSPPWPVPQLFQTGPQSFQLVFPPAGGSDPMWQQGRQVSIELTPPRADCGNSASPEFRAYLDLFVLALQKMFLLPVSSSTSSVGSPTLLRSNTLEPGRASSSPSSRLSAGSGCEPPLPSLKHGSRPMSQALQANQALQESLPSSQASTNQPRQASLPLSQTSTDQPRQSSLPLSQTSYTPQLQQPMGLGLVPPQQQQNVGSPQPVSPHSQRLSAQLSSLQGAPQNATSLNRSSQGMQTYGVPKQQHHQQQQQQQRPALPPGIQSPAQPGLVRPPQQTAQPAQQARQATPQPPHQPTQSQFAQPVQQPTPQQQHERQHEQQQQPLQPQLTSQPPQQHQQQQQQQMHSMQGLQPMMHAPPGVQVRPGMPGMAPMMYLSPGQPLPPGMMYVPQQQMPGRQVLQPVNTGPGQPGQGQAGQQQPQQQLGQQFAQQGQQGQQSLQQQPHSYLQQASQPQQQQYAQPGQPQPGQPQQQQFAQPGQFHASQQQLVQPGQPGQQFLQQPGGPYVQASTTGTSQGSYYAQPPQQVQHVAGGGAGTGQKRDSCVVM